MVLQLGRISWFQVWAAVPMLSSSLHLSSSCFFLFWASFNSAAWVGKRKRWWEEAEKESERKNGEHGWGNGGAMRVFCELHRPLCPQSGTGTQFQNWTELLAQMTLQCVRVQYFYLLPQDPIWIPVIIWVKPSSRVTFFTILGPESLSVLFYKLMRNADAHEERKT